MLTRKYGGAAEKGIAIKLQSITAQITSQGALLARGKMRGNIQLRIYRLLRINVEGNAYLRITRVLGKNCNLAAVKGIFGKHVQTVYYIPISGVQCVAEKKQKASAINKWPVLFAMMGCREKPKAKRIGREKKLYGSRQFTAHNNCNLAAIQIKNP